MIFFVNIAGRLRSQPVFAAGSGYYILISWLKTGIFAEKSWNFAEKIMAPRRKGVYHNAL
jgi:hypothetical protein